MPQKIDDLGFLPGGVGQAEQLGKRLDQLRSDPWQAAGARK